MKMPGNMKNMMKQAEKMKAEMDRLQEEAGNKLLETVSGGGMVKVKVNGKQELLDIKINPECVDPNDVDMLQDLVKAAVNEAVKDSQEMVSSAMSKVTGGLSIPGLF